MKKLIFSLSTLLVTLFLPSLWKSLELNAQNVAITDDDTYTADPSAMLDVKSINKGVLLPRLTTAQRNLVSNPATGLLIFDTDENAYYFYNGTVWVNVSGSQTWSKTGSNVHLTDSTNNVGVGTSNPQNKLSVKGDASSSNNEAIFSVVNVNGDTLLAVYPDGTRIYVNDSPAKAIGSKGGFAVGGFSPAKAGVTNEYLRVTPDSVRIYIEENSGAKAIGSKGGFAVGGFSPAKTVINDYLSVNSDSIKASKSFYLPRLTTTERDNIGFTPSEALIIFNTTDECMEIYKEGRWSNIWCYSCAPSIIQQSVNASICSNGDTSFSVSAAGVDLTYQWQESSDDGNSWIDIVNGGTTPVYSNSSTNVLSMSNIPANLNAFQYRCAVSGSCNPAAISDAVILNISTSDLTVTTQPENIVLLAGCNTSFTIATSAYGQCQWQKSTDGGSTWNNIVNGGTSPVISGTSSLSLSLSNIPLSYNGYLFRCVVTNPCGTGATSDNASITVNNNVLTATAATNITGVSFTANWNAVPGATSYYLDVSTVADFSSFVSGFNNLFVNNLTTYTVSYLSHYTTYYYRIRANNFCRNENSNTITLTTLPFFIGEVYGGGIVAYVDGTGQHGLIAAASDQSTEAEWGCIGTAISGADSTAKGTGAQNTIDIVEGCATAGIAARLASDLVLNGYNDWFLPSKDELNQLYLNNVAIGGFTLSYYWSSSEYSVNNAWRQNFGSGNNDNENKDYGISVRCIRSF